MGMGSTPTPRRLLRVTCRQNSKKSISSNAGYHLGVLNTCLEWMAADLDFEVAKGGSVVVSAALIGASFGSLGAGQFADSVGPGRAMAINNLSLLVGSLLYSICPGGIWAAIIGQFPTPLTVSVAFGILQHSHDKTKIVDAKLQLVCRSFLGRIGGRGSLSVRPEVLGRDLSCQHTRRCGHIESGELHALMACTPPNFSKLSKLILDR